MEQNEEIVFEIMVTFDNLLLKEIERYNKFHNTDFEIIKITE